MELLVPLAPLLAGAVTAAALRLPLARRRAPQLPPPLADPSPVAVLLPVRDEALNIEPCLATLLAQTTPLRVFVLDDGSTDSTRDLAAGVAVTDSRVEIVDVAPPAAGRSGKVHALCAGLAALERSGSGARWVLAIDADARPAADALARTLAAAQALGLSAVSLAAHQRTVGLGEALLTPLVFALLDAQLGDWEAVARGESDGVANGQFFLIEREALARSGGFDAIRDQPLDDIALARQLVAAGERVGFWRAGASLEVRMYRGFAASFRGWRRNLALIFGSAPAPAWRFVSLSMLPALLAAAALCLGRPEVAAICWGAGSAASLLARLGTGSNPVAGLVYPCDALALATCLTVAVRDRRRGRLTAWRGRPLDP